ncbi:MAG: hypothetical protein MPJ50_07885 [Pirellulales bacterium]|nr:hypothetical protein [Pirellulales bacterium]
MDPASGHPASHSQQDNNPYASPLAATTLKEPMSWRDVWRSGEFRRSALSILGTVRIITGLMISIAFCSLPPTHSLLLCLPFIAYGIGNMITGWDLRSCFSFGRVQAIILCCVQISLSVAIVCMAIFVGSKPYGVAIALLAVPMCIAQIGFLRSSHTRAVCKRRQHSSDELHRDQRMPQGKLGIANAGVMLFALTDFLTMLFLPVSLTA